MRINLEHFKAQLLQMNIRISDNFVQTLIYFSYCTQVFDIAVCSFVSNEGEISALIESSIIQDTG